MTEQKLLMILEYLLLSEELIKMCFYVPKTLANEIILLNRKFRDNYFLRCSKLFLRI